jgi:dienelactone hydrolase
MRWAGVILLSVLLFGLSSARLDSSERPTTRTARAEKGDFSYVTQPLTAEPASGVTESEDHFEWRSAAAYAAFEDIWTGTPDQQGSPVQEQMLASAGPDVGAEWAFAPTTLMPEEPRIKVTKVVPHHPENAATRIYVLYGQYGWTTSSGMYYLAQSLARYGEVSVHHWDDRTIVQDAKRQSGKIVIIGYSLGANSTVAIANKLPRVDLIVAYDPSRLSPLAHETNGEFTQHVKPSVRRAICFYNPYAWYFGGARLEGSQVELFAIDNFHLTVAVDQRLHDITEEAVKQVALGSQPANAVATTQPSKPVAERSANSLPRTAARSETPNG